MTLYDLRKKIQERIDILERQKDFSRNIKDISQIELIIVKSWIHEEIVLVESRLSELEKDKGTPRDILDCRINELHGVLGK